MFEDQPVLLIRRNERTRYGILSHDEIVFESTNPKRVVKYLVAEFPALNLDARSAGSKFESGWEFATQDEVDFFVGEAKIDNENVFAGIAAFS